MEKNQERPLETLPQALGEYAAQGAARFCAPGHKGRGMGGIFHSDVAAWDAAELSADGCLRGALSLAEREMAVAYGAKASFFVTGGSGAALQTMLLALSPTDTLLFARDVPSAALFGAALKGYDPRYVSPAYDAGAQLCGMVTPAALDKRLRETHATAVLLVSPNIYGFCADIPALSAVAHAHGALLLVDASLGAHFPFSDALPTAMAGYADLFVYAQYQTMNALTQGASLHVGDCRISPDAVRRALSALAADDPSCLTALSLDWAVFSAKRQGWTEQVRRMRALRDQLRRVNGISLLPSVVGAGVAAQDDTRLALDVTGRGLTGYGAAGELRAQGVFPAAADARRVILLTTPEDDPAWYERLLEALIRLPYAIPTEDCTVESPLPLPEKRISLRDAVLFARIKRVPLTEAGGTIAASCVGVCPCGRIAVAPGEAWTNALVQALLELEQRGARLFGVCDGLIDVVDEA